ncbi:hypothetical protein MYSTI_02752 [Myxococcus stipitatus DSM 14675]|uniref:Uncharacterized protein n=1 Tax=Myxococcus stipitatus (strain DSM 14675 / JCM 12634 / Mx s8) TaxID=1278073 RepID=L7U7J0_MYXSD|nr:hypothetical protein [Myxococcus stipitatus]AGC44068.1 hypothetical protein MYSTI_02752 [Myxococcus stipitatus DSM 14675]
MTIEAVASTAQTFLKSHIRKNDFFTPDDELDPNDASSARLHFFRALPHPKLPNTIMYTFSYGRAFSEGDDELQELVQGCLDALKQAHPEVSQFDIHIRLQAG